MKNYADTLSELAGKQLRDLINARASDIQAALDGAEDCKLTVGLSCKLTIVKDRLYCTSSMRFGVPTTDEVEGSAEIDDPTAPKLPGMEDAADKALFAKAANEFIAKAAVKAKGKKG